MDVLSLFVDNIYFLNQLNNDMFRRLFINIDVICDESATYCVRRKPMLQSLDDLYAYMLAVDVFMGTL